MPLTLANYEHNLSALRERACAGLFVLGADDPEMRDIEKHLANLGLDYCHALNNLDSRVGPGEAYHGTVITEQMRVAKNTGRLVIGIEVGVTEPGIIELSIDHHRPGDYGDQEDYAKSASRSQIALLLGEELTYEQRLIAADDHCAGAAIKGEYKDIDPVDASAQHITSIAEEHQKTTDEIKSYVHELTDDIADIPLMPDMPGVIDLRELSQGWPAGYSLGYLCTQAALYDLGMPGLVLAKDKTPNAPTRVMLTGTPSKEQIAFFADEWAGRNGVVNLFGLANRRYYGGYLAHELVASQPRLQAAA